MVDHILILKANPKNDYDYKCFQYTITVALNHEQVGRDPQRKKKPFPFINQYEWKNIFLHRQSIRKNLKQAANQLILMLSLFHTTRNIKDKQYNSENLRQVILLMVTTSVMTLLCCEKIIRYLQKQPLNQNGNNYCMNYIYQYERKDKIKLPENVCLRKS